MMSELSIADLEKEYEKTVERPRSAIPLPSGAGQASPFPAG